MPRLRFTGRPPVFWPACPGTMGRIATCILRDPLQAGALMPGSSPILTKQDMARCIGSIAQEIRGTCSGEELALVGIYRRGVPFAERVFGLLRSHYPSLLLGRVDISLYRDDLRNLEMMPKLVGSDIPFDLDGRHVILFDEVIYTGRTSRAGLEELLDHGRPGRVQIAALIDRGGRELPVQADYVGRKVETTPEQRVSVRFEEVDGEDAVYLQEGGARR